MHVSNEEKKDSRIVTSNTLWYFLPLFSLGVLSAHTHIYFQK